MKKKEVTTDTLTRLRITKEQKQRLRQMAIMMNHNSVQAFVTWIVINFLTKHK